MKRRLLIATMTAALGSMLAACTGAKDADSPEELCDAMCAHLLGPGLHGCGKDDATPEQCSAECQDHLASGKSNLEQVACAVDAPTCKSWGRCGDLL